TTRGSEGNLSLKKVAGCKFLDKFTRALLAVRALSVRSGSNPLMFDKPWRGQTKLIYKIANFYQFF
ncbi:MAG: hypothetical protein RRY78_06790, partial [Clostridia bacterium]